MKSRIITVLCIALLFVCGLSLSACTSASVGSADYSITDAQRAFYVEYGTVQSVRNVSLHSETSSMGTGIGVGAVAGGVTGGVIGGLIGGSTGAAIGAAAGGVAGGVAGGYIGSSNETTDGLEITVRLDTGQVVAIVQGKDIMFYPHQRVQLVTGDGRTRVAPI